MIFDTHAHLNFEVFAGKEEEALQKAQEAGVEKILVCGTDLPTSQKAWQLAQKHPPLFASAGIHPHHAFNYLADPSVILVNEVHPESDSGVGRQGDLPRMTPLEKDLKRLELLLKEEKVLAIGEVGLDKHQYQNTKYEDYHNGDNFLELQKQLFIAQIKLAIKYQKSLIIHDREATEETLEILQAHWNAKLTNRTVFHCCQPEDILLEFAKNHHIFIGVDGDITYKKTKQEFIKKVPLELLVLETDSPYLLPQSLKDVGETINQPANIVIIAQEVAKILEISLEKLNQTTFQNSLKLLAIS